MAKRDDGWTLTGLLFAVAFFLTGIAAWLTHAVWIVRVLASDAGATVGQMVLGVLGVVVPPVGVIHGLVIWFT